MSETPRRPGRFDRLRAEKKQYPHLYKKGARPKAPGLDEKTCSALAKVLRIMLTDDKQKR